MRIAVISDVHGNLVALRAVHEDIQSQGADTIICLGDSIGYGPEPDAVVRFIEERKIPWIMGNHELGIADPSYLEWFNPSARKSLMMTRDLLSAETIEIISELGRTITIEDILFVHGCPPDSTTEYVFQVHDDELVERMSSIEQRLCFVGHTHDLEIIALKDGSIQRARLREGTAHLDKTSKYIINVGSVGQPRDGNNRAKYVILDTRTQIVNVRFMAYDIAETARRILELGFPRINATRLW